MVGDAPATQGPDRLETQLTQQGELITIPTAATHNPALRACMATQQGQLEQLPADLTLAVLRGRSEVLEFQPPTGSLAVVGSDQQQRSQHLLFTGDQGHRLSAEQQTRHKCFCLSQPVPEQTGLKFWKEGALIRPLQPSEMNRFQRFNNQ